jgi:alkylmercury lyase
MEDIGGLQQFLDSLHPDERMVRRLAFQSLLHGIPMTIQDLAQRMDMRPQQAYDLVQRLANKGVVVWNTQSAAIVGSGGLSVIPSPHRLVMEDFRGYAWCAADAIGIPAALEKDAAISSVCHESGEPIFIHLRRGEILDFSHPDIRVFVVEADTSQSVSGHT